MIVDRKSSEVSPIFNPSVRNLLLALFIMPFVLASILIASKPTLVDKAVNKSLEMAYSDIGYGRYGTNVDMASLKNIVLKDLGDEQFETLSLDIKYKHWKKVTAKRQQALNDGFLVTDDDYIPVKINLQGQELKAKMRLKGDMTDHLQGNKWSFRVKLSGDNYLFGFKKFNIQHPQTRGYLGQFVIDDVFRRYGLITPKHRFVNVEINGEKIGIMLLEEHFSKELLERNKRKNGVIVKFDESLFWESLRLNNGAPGLLLPRVNPFNNYVNASLDGFSKSKINEDLNLSKQYELAVSMLRGFTEGTISPSEVFDINLMGRYLAITSFFKAGHETLFNNQRFYLNPLTLKIEPIPFDANVGYDIKVIGEPIVDKILEDPKIRKVFMATLDDLRVDFRDESYISALETMENDFLEKLRNEFYFLEKFDYSALGACSEMLNFQLPAYIHAYKTMEGGEYFLELRNAICEDIEIISIESGNVTDSQDLNSQFRLPAMLDAVGLGESAAPSSLKINIGKHLNDSDLKIVVKRLTNGKSLTHYAVKYSSAVDGNPFPSNTIDDLLRTHSFFEIINNTLHVRKGIFNVDGNILIPCGYKVFIHPGAILRFDLDGSLYSCSSLDIAGTKKDQVVFEPKEGVESWEGIAVYNAAVASNWSYAVVKKTKGITFPYLKLTGGVTFYKSNTYITDSQFDENFGEDALNIIHSDFILDNVDISNSFSDGFDGDFVTGKITGGVFSNIGSGSSSGGDAIDVSGSDIKVFGSLITNIGDKGISIGEGSKALIGDVVITNSGIAVASKDGSTVRVENADIDETNDVAYMSYMKKPVYGGASLIVNDENLDRETLNYAVQKNNTLIINGDQIMGTSLDVESMYAGKKKKS